MKRVTVENCLATCYPEVAKEWHPTKNGDITPRDVLPGSGKKFWFQCGKGHEWKAGLNKRTKRRHNCPCCSHYKACEGNCLSTCYPKVAKEWHPMKNGDITPQDVIAGSAKKYWFKCGKGHEWRASLCNRMHGRGCPYCANLKVCDDNCLATTHPNVAAEWHLTKNNIITPRDVVASSPKKYWFKCGKGHEWRASLCKRTTNKSGCPYCANRLVCKDNCLSQVYPEIAAEWHPIKNGKVTSNNVVAGGLTKYWFRCKNGHEWKASIDTRKRCGCPRCCESKGEKKLTEIAEELCVKKVIHRYTKQYKDPRIKRIKVLSFDIAFFVGKSIYVVEFQGMQHYKPVNWSGKMTQAEMDDGFERIKLCDKIKRKMCRQHGIKYLAVHYNQMEQMRDIVMAFLTGNGL